MITEKEALQVGKLIIKARQDFKLNNKSKAAKKAFNRTAWGALRAMWFDVFTDKLKEKFSCSFDSYYTQIKRY